ncbi:hypothetical protein ACFLTU_02350 [Bacteroidota bacterium]
MKHIIISVLLIFSLHASGQDFMRSVGIRGGLTSGFSYRGYLNPELAYEGLLSFRSNGLQFTVLRQHFEPALWQISDGFFMTYGYGGHIGFTNTHTYNQLFKTVHYSGNKFSPLIGLDGYLGIEYHFPGIPVLMGLDYKPFFEMSLREYFQMSAWDVAFTLKYKF